MHGRCGLRAGDECLRSVLVRGVGVALVADHAHRGTTTGNLTPIRHRVPTRARVRSLWTANTTWAAATVHPVILAHLRLLVESQATPLNSAADTATRTPDDCIIGLRSYTPGPRAR